MKKLLLLLIIISGCDSIENNFSAKPIIVLTFDDGHKSIYDLAFPVMKNFNYPGVNFTPTGWVNNDGCLTINQLLEMQNSGWETGGHSVTHANLTTIPIDSAKEEIQNDYNDLIRFGLTHNCFALPAGHSNPEIDKNLKQYYDIIRTSYNEHYNYPLSKDRLGYYQVEENDDVNSLLQRVSHGATEGECLIIFGFHQFTIEQPTFICMMNIGVFKNFLAELKSRNYQVLTLSQALDKLGK